MCCGHFPETQTTTGQSLLFSSLRCFLLLVLLSITVRLSFWFKRWGAWGTNYFQWGLSPIKLHFGADEDEVEQAETKPCWQHKMEKGQTNKWSLARNTKKVKGRTDKCVTPPNKHNPGDSYPGSHVLHISNHCRYWFVVTLSLSSNPIFDSLYLIIVANNMVIVISSS